MSKEHIWAQWMRPYLPKDAPTYSSVDVSVHKTHETRKEKRENRDAYSGTLKLVCEPCNNGWMSRLQNAAKPILLPLMRGERVSLTPRARETLAAWITMFVMVSEFQRPDKVAFQASERELFMKTLKPPTNYAVWLGMYVREKWQGITTHCSIAVNSEADGVNATNPDGGLRHNTQSMTVVVGKVYIHVLGSIFPEFARKQRLDRAGLPLARLWPTGLKPFRWHSADLTEGDARAVSTALIDYYRRKKAEK